MLEVKFITETTLREAHDLACSIYPKSTKMYLDLTDIYWRYGLNRDVAEYVVICDICQRVKAEHQRQQGYFNL